MVEEKRRRERAYLPPRFWKAVLALRNHTVVHCESDYLDELTTGRWVPGSLWEAINIVGDYLDRVIEDGWMDDKD